MTPSDPAPHEPAPRSARRGETLTLAALGVLAFSAGLGLKAFADTPAGLRGTAEAQAAAAAPAPEGATAAQSFLAGGVWRPGPCEHTSNFQAFAFAPAGNAVEVGAGRPGEGERLELLRVARSGAMVEVETRVCAPVGCNQTFEQYRVLDADRIQEWRFEGRLPQQPPYVLVAEGAATDGSGPGRIFNRCRG